MPIDEIKNVLYVGAGTMGCYNSLVSAMAGYDVVLYDTSPDALAASIQRQKDWIPRLIELKRADEKIIEVAIENIFRTTDLVKAAGNADLLSESVFEQRDLKRKVHQELDRLLPPHAIMTTNTSTLLISEIEDVVQRGDKFAAMHYHQPSPLVDLMPGPRTSDRTMDILKRFTLSQGQVFVEMKKERPGYIHNALYSRLLGSAMFLAALGLGTVEDIDRAWMISQNTKAGPFGMMDYVGLNVVYDATKANMEKADGNEEMKGLILDLIKPLIDRGDLGIKTGRGFYHYPDPAFIQPEFTAGCEPVPELKEALVYAVFSEAMLMVQEGFAVVEDVDRCWMLTHNPKWGPFGMIDREGLEIVKERIEERGRQLNFLAEEAGKIADFLQGYIGKGYLGEKSGRGFYIYPDPAYSRKDFISFNNQRSVR
ncbi:MAG: 3-hydroxyacyl-CoA dehydrogenase NAD-binding domain-containing protein [Desulfobacterales bacterium]